MVPVKQHKQWWGDVVGRRKVGWLAQVESMQCSDPSNSWMTYPCVIAKRPLSSCHCFVATRGPSALGCQMVVKDIVTMVREAVRDPVDPHLGAWDGRWLPVSSDRWKVILLFVFCNAFYWFLKRCVCPGAVVLNSLNCSCSARSSTPSNTKSGEHAKIRKMSLWQIHLES